MHKNQILRTLEIFINRIISPRNLDGLIIKGCFGLLLSLWAARFAPTIQITLGLDIPLLNTLDFMVEKVPDYMFWVLTIIILVIIILIWCKNKEANHNLGLFQNGLTNNLIEPLTALIKKSNMGSFIPIKTDISCFVRDNILESPEKALNEVNDGIQRLLDNAEDINYEVQVLYGGLIAVPFAFYTGMEIDDKFPITVFDFNRQNGTWDKIENHMFSKYESEFSYKYNGKFNNEVLVAVSISYQINFDELIKAFPNYPISYFTVNNVQVDNHWELDFHKNLQRNFLKFMQEISHDGVEKIHLVVAAQNSVSFNLGRIYDNRNLPSLIVYQYERGKSKKYPWGLQMNTSGQCAQIIYNR